MKVYKRIVTFSVGPPTVDEKTVRAVQIAMGMVESDANHSNSPFKVALKGRKRVRLLNIFSYIFSIWFFR